MTCLLSVYYWFIILLYLVHYCFLEDKFPGKRVFQEDGFDWALVQTVFPEHHTRLPGTTNRLPGNPSSRKQKYSR